MAKAKGFNFVLWSDAAQTAELTGDWHRAKECWYRAAMECTDGDWRAYYNEREDAAGEKIKAAAAS